MSDQLYEVRLMLTEEQYGALENSLFWEMDNPPGDADDSYLEAVQAVYDQVTKR